MYRLYQTLLCVSSVLYLIEASPQFQCPEHQIKKDGIKIQSPLYPKYPLKFRCWYNISCPQDKMIVVKFEQFDFPERFSLMKANYGPVLEDCAANYLQMWIPETGDKSLKFCGDELKGLSLIANESMNLLFQSFDHHFPTQQDHKLGFEAQITFVSKAEYSKYQYTFITEEKDIKVSWGSQPYTFNVKAPLGKVPILELSKTSSDAEAKMHVTVKPNEDTLITPTRMYSVPCEKEIKGKSLNSNFAQFILDPVKGNVECNVKVKFVDPYPLCGGVHEILETDKHFIYNLGYSTPDVCVWTVIMKNTTKSFDVMANMILNGQNSKGLCDKDHIMGFVKQNNQVTEILPATCGEKEGFYISVDRSDSKRDLEVTVITYIPFIFRNHRDQSASEGNLQYFP